MSKRTKPSKKIFFSPTHITIVIGVLLVFSAFFWKISQNNLNFNSQPKITNNNLVLSTERKPQVLKIEKLNLNLKIDEGNVINGKWEVSENGVTYFVNSSLPGQGSNIVIYGHNKANILGLLPGIEIGDIIVISTLDNSDYVYIVISKEVITPDRVEVINPTKTEILTIYTCTGLFDSKRLVVKADPYIH